MEVPNDVLPHSSEVEVETTPVETTEKAKPTEELKPTQPQEKGSKTPEVNLYKALEEERKIRQERDKKIAELEEQLLKSSEPQITEAFSDEGKLLENKIKTLESELISLKEEKNLETIFTQFPELKTLESEFNSYRLEFPSVKLENIARLFLNEKGISGTPRKGLEKQSSSISIPTSDGMTAEEIADLRRNNHRKYLDMLMNGKIRFEDLK